MNENAENPLTSSFGERPCQYVELSVATDELISDIASTHPVHRACIVSASADRARPSSSRMR